MFDIAICNDNVNELVHMNYLLETYRLEKPWPVINIRRFQSLYDLVDCIRAGRTFSLYILGHGSELWMNSLSPAAVLRREEPRGAIITLTSDRTDTLAPAPGDPLRLTASFSRPVNDKAFYRVLDRLIGEHYAQSSSLLPCLHFPVQKGTLELPFARISHMLYEDHVVTCWLVDDGSSAGDMMKVTSPVLRKPFYQLIRPLLLETRFSQVSTAWVINLDFVETMTQRPPEVLMNDGTRIRIPSNAISGALEEYTRYLSRPGRKTAAPVGG